VFRNGFCGGGVDRNQSLICAPVQLGVVVAIEGENLQGNDKVISSELKTPLGKEWG
jgi:hypothetical protein